MADSDLIDVQLLKYFKSKLSGLYVSKSELDKSVADAKKDLESQIGSSESKQIREAKEQAIASNFAMQKTGKVYGAKVWKFATNQTSDCEKTRDNVGLVCEASSADKKGKDDYENLFLFQWWNCNYVRDDDSTARLTYLEGEDGYKTDGDADVGVLMPTLYRKQIETDTYYEYLWSDSPNHALGLKPISLAVKTDGTVLPYMIMAKYPSVLGADGLLHSQPNGKTVRGVSYETINDYQKKGKGYWGCPSTLYMWAQELFAIKYGTKNNCNVYKGCIGYHIYKPALVKSSEKTKSIIVEANQQYFKVGYYYNIGYPTFNNGRENNTWITPTMCAYAEGAMCTNIETLKDGKMKITLDCEAFSTADITDSNGNKCQIYITSAPWHTGRTDKLPDKRDGVVYSNASTVEPFRIQGVEMALGCRELILDMVAQYSSSGINIYRAYKGEPLTTNNQSILSQYHHIYTIPKSVYPDTTNVIYIGDVTHVGDSWAPSAAGTSSTTGTGCKLLMGAIDNYSIIRQISVMGSLWTWSGSGVSLLESGNYYKGINYEDYTRD